MEKAREARGSPPLVLPCKTSETSCSPSVPAAREVVADGAFPEGARAWREAPPLPAAAAVAVVVRETARRPWGCWTRLGRPPGLSATVRRPGVMTAAAAAAPLSPPLAFCTIEVGALRAEAEPVAVVVTLGEKVRGSPSHCLSDLPRWVEGVAASASEAAAAAVPLLVPPAAPPGPASNNNSLSAARAAWAKKAAEEDEPGVVLALVPGPGSVTT